MLCHLVYCGLSEDLPDLGLPPLSHLDYDLNSFIINEDIISVNEKTETGHCGFFIDCVFGPR